MFKFAGGDLGSKFATPILSAGWRLKPEEALHIMLNEVERCDFRGLELHIAALEGDYDMARTIIGPT